MPSDPETSQTRPRGHVLVLLVLAVLTGLLGMHALAPGGGLPTAHSGAGHTMTADRPVAHEPAAPCTHLSGGVGHLDHADATCAAAGIGSPYTPPAPDAVPARDATAPAILKGSAAGAHHDGAPPDLSELQLLRI
ncbi:DUF6153 family protein [Streptomyces chromofuscus]|uniref:Uncharacterized protein n=1 Tax=Streptomyces chromofuscus TaxID=42881 RepID=A0A7M2T983_STRCW|nr:DUF6153 family protein [Streptomyces chromofuscus]QOV44814.1 hypothetical protein IPT68_02005 [Streptomyces chromofuscus]GGT00011.1 hypothetical protein GCM10010254_20040 [Streptomyces chromofuscus]